MKKLLSTLFVACLGGLIALSTARYFYSYDKNNTNQITKPFSHQNVTLANLSANQSSSFNNDFTNAAEKSVNAVVHIKTISEQVSNLNYDPFAEWFYGPQKRQQNYNQEGSGSGVIISDDGYIVTNNHVVAGADKIEVVLNDRRTYIGELIGADASTDVALIRIKEKNLPFLTYGNSELVKVGEWVLAVGNPFNLESTVTAGIISAKGRSNILDVNKRPIESFIQTDAAVNPGNSGGALVTTNGELIGINTAIASNNGAYQGYSFAVPVNIVKKIVGDLVEFGMVQRAYFGVSIRDLDAKFSADKNIKLLKGVYVSAVTSGGSAEDAGIQEGDVITKIEATQVGSVSELQEQLSKYRPGDKVNIVTIRNNKEMNREVILKSLDNTTTLIKKSELIKKSFSALGASFEEMSAGELAKLRINNGVKIKKLIDGKFAQIGIKEGFIITSIDKKKVSNIQDITNLLENKSGTVLIEGFYPNGARAYYGFSL
ncbi:MAG: trypsin-like peptidase domain-containing protein [Bacteroidota bacterium]|nr:trypsin-like peptidase domain-containing protein [Bacteroidota bacterium]MDP3145616.1 trypsin-like peptidase domain-containing protein [Bacteroidota bacterium]MDP3558711.1 trypsin-like peptidase domain-containing protein [Bacteroidota bacterium]